MPGAVLLTNVQEEINGVDCQLAEIPPPSLPARLAVIRLLIIIGELKSPDI